MKGTDQVNEWVVIHKIKALYDEGRGLSVRAIGKELTHRKTALPDRWWVSSFPVGGRENKTHT